MGRPTPQKVNGATLGRLPPRGATFTHFEVWSYRACQPLQMWQISHFCEIHSLSYEASKFFAMLNALLNAFAMLNAFRKVYAFVLAAISPLGRTSYPPIAYKSHSTPFPIRPHVLTPHSWLCDKNCGRSSAPKKKWNGGWRITLMLPCHIWQAPLTRMYISRRKCEMVLAVAKNTPGCQAVSRVVARRLLGLSGGCQGVARRLLGYLGGCQVISWAVLHHRKQGANLGCSAPQGCNFYPILRYGLTEPASLFKCGKFQISVKSTL